MLAYFGYPRADEHDAERAVRAGLQLVNAVPALETAAAAPTQVQVRIATGLVVVGDLIGAGAAQEQAVADLKRAQQLAADLQALGDALCPICVDWTARRPHIAGAVGAALTKRYFDLGWIERMQHSRAVLVTAAGRRGFSETFGIGVPIEEGKGGTVVIRRFGSNGGVEDAVG